MNEQSQEQGNYQLYGEIFKEKFNILFHLQKKEQCELYLEYSNATEGRKQKIRQA